MLHIPKGYGVEERSLRLMGSYFTDRYNRVTLGSVVSEWQRVTRGCPQGSAFGPLIWNIFQNDLIYTVDPNMNMYADDHQFYAVGSTLSDVHDGLAVCTESASSWYRANLLKGNLDKYQTMALGCGKESVDSMIDNDEVRSTECLKLLGVCIDNNLCFDEHTSSISKKNAQRLGVLMRLRNLIATQTELQPATTGHSYSHV